MNNNDKKINDLPFEEALDKLENLVEEMEDGELPLDKMIEYFERGTALASHCDKKLKALEKKIQVLVKENAEGGEWNDFDESSERKSAALGSADADEKETPEEPEEDLLF